MRTTTSSPSIRRRISDGAIATTSPAVPPVGEMGEDSPEQRRRYDTEGKMPAPRTEPSEGSSRAYSAHTGHQAGKDDRSASQCANTAHPHPPSPTAAARPPPAAARPPPAAARPPPAARPIHIPHAGSSGSDSTLSYGSWEVASVTSTDVGCFELVGANQPTAGTAPAPAHPATPPRQVAGPAGLASEYGLAEFPSPSPSEESEAEFRSLRAAIPELVDAEVMAGGYAVIGGQVLMSDQALLDVRMASSRPPTPAPDAAALESDDEVEFDEDWRERLSPEPPGTPPTAEQMAHRAMNTGFDPHLFGSVGGATLPAERAAGGDGSEPREACGPSSHSNLAELGEGEDTNGDAAPPSHHMLPTPPPEKETAEAETEIRAEAESKTEAETETESASTSSSAATTTTAAVVAEATATYITTATATVAHAPQPAPDAAGGSVSEPGSYTAEDDDDDMACNDAGDEEDEAQGAYGAPVEETPAADAAPAPDTTSHAAPTRPTVVTRDIEDDVVLVDLSNGPTAAPTFQLPAELQALPASAKGKDRLARAIKRLVVLERAHRYAAQKYQAAGAHLATAILPASVHTHLARRRAEYALVVDQLEEELKEESRVVAELQQVTGCCESVWTKVAPAFSRTRRAEKAGLAVSHDIIEAIAQHGPFRDADGRDLVFSTADARIIARNTCDMVVSERWQDGAWKAATCVASGEEFVLQEA